MILALLLFFLVLICLPDTARAREGDVGETKEGDEYEEGFSLLPDTGQLQQVMDEALPESIDFTDLAKDFLAGDFSGLLEKAKTVIFSELTKEIETNKTAVLRIIIVAVMGALFTNIAATMKNGQISDTGFYVIYLLMISILTAAFGEAVMVLKDAMETLLAFMTALCPIFFAAVAFGGGSLSAAGFGQFTLLLIGGVESVMYWGLIPLTQIYMVLVMANNISREDYLSKLCGLIKSGSGWILKTMFGLITGLNVIQGMILPMADSAKTGGLAKLVSAIPGIGNGADAVTKIVVGSGTLVKNGVGAAACGVLVFLCLIPVIKLAVITLLYHIAAAAIQPVADKRMVACITGAADGAMLLFKILLYSALLFLITIAIVCTTTNSLYYGG